MVNELVEVEGGKGEDVAAVLVEVPRGGGPRLVGVVDFVVVEDDGVVVVERLEIDEGGNGGRGAVQGAQAVTPILCR